MVAEWVSFGDEKLLNFSVELENSGPERAELLILLIYTNHGTPVTGVRPLSLIHFNN